VLTAGSNSSLARGDESSAGRSGAPHRDAFDHHDLNLEVVDGESARSSAVTRSAGLRMPTSAIRWYSSRVKSLGAVRAVTRKPSALLARRMLARTGIILRAGMEELGTGQAHPDCVGVDFAAPGKQRAAARRTRHAARERALAALALTQLSAAA
jgi:hypothetical protein